MNFEEHIEESYKGFGTSSHLDLVDLKIMYYGRINVYVSFTDHGEYAYETEESEMDRPDGVICYEVNDVVAKKVSSPSFYYNIFRWSKGGSLDDIRRYSRDDFYRDIEKLRGMSFDEDIFEFYLEEAVKDVRIRHYFERLWILTENLSRTNREFTRKWREILMKLGYNRIADPSGTGIISIGSAPVVLILDHESMLEIDILPAQQHREDPRQYVRDTVARKVKRLRNRRNRIAKKSPTRDKNKKLSVTDQIKQSIKAFRGLDQ